jgi:hypothetical protein
MIVIVVKEVKDKFDIIIRNITLTLCVYKDKKRRKRRRRSSNTPTYIKCIHDISQRISRQKRNEKCIDHDDMNMLIKHGKSMSLRV